MSSGTLKPKIKLVGRRFEQLGPVLLARELVERQVAADRRERAGVFGQAVFLELGLGELAPGDVAILGVNRPSQPSYFHELVPK